MLTYYFWCTPLNFANKKDFLQAEGTLLFFTHKYNKAFTCYAPCTICKFWKKKSPGWLCSTYLQYFLNLPVAIESVFNFFQIFKLFPSLISQHKAKSQYQRKAWNEQTSRGGHIPVWIFVEPSPHLMNSKRKQNFLKSPSWYHHFRSVDWDKIIETLETRENMGWRK